MSEIFISYSRNDRPRAESIARGLEAAGWSVWWDRIIPAGREFEEVIETELNASKLAIVLWSKRSVASEWVLIEAGAAADRDKLVPILIEQGVHIPLRFSRIQAADLIDWDGNVEAPSFQKLVADIAGRIRPSQPPVEVLPAGDSLKGEEGSDGTGEAPALEEDSVPADANIIQESAPRQPLPSGLLESRAGLTWILAAVFAINFVETKIDTIVREQFGWGVDVGNRVAAAFRGLEGNLSFESHDVTNWFAVYGYSLAYFFVLPILGLSVAATLWVRKDVQAYRILCLSIVADYLISLGFFLFLPVPERWSYADSGAILLSDRWSSSLIELVRPISAIDNCFPSTHVSLTVVVILVGYAAGLRFRHTICALGTTVIFSTFVLGIHWLPDIVAGVAVGILSVALARYARYRRKTALPRLVPSIASVSILRGKGARVGALAHS
ncbi:MAG: hypothetical protein C5B57_12975 [Blastocatellia bacterium]|nr:MAG: hypothetical protein C5B57_12975 [Blastocatellia bacterium]